MHGHLHRLPHEVDQMTIAEIAMALDDNTDKPRLPAGYKAIDPASMVNWRPRWMRPIREQLEEARRE